MIDKKIKELKEANIGNIVDVLVDIIKSQDERISELEKIEKSKYDIGCTVPTFTLEGNTIPYNNTITKDGFIQNTQYNSGDTEIYIYNEPYDSIDITKDYIITKVTETFKEITENIMNNESMTDIEFEYIFYLKDIGTKYHQNTGYKLNFGVFINRGYAIDYDNNIIFTNGKIEIKLCEAIELGGIEDEMKKRLSNLSQHLLKLGYPNIS